MTNRMQRSDDPDRAIRLRAFSVVERLAVSTGGRIPWAEIARGFLYEDETVHLASRALGIFKPRQMSAALSIRTVKPRTGRPSWYRDQSTDFDPETGLLAYDLVRDLRHPTNESLRRAYERGAPLIYFLPFEPALYEAIWPVWVEDFREDEGRVFLSAREPESAEARSVQEGQVLTGQNIRKRSYSLRMTKHRNHQAWFSSQIRSLYGYRCAFSNLPLSRLLVGAHIKPDKDGGPASLKNGICMSTLHHAAFDAYLIGVDPDLRIHVSGRVIDVEDGPLLTGLQGLDGRTMRVPKEPRPQPDPEFLEWRYERFKAAQT